MTHAAALYESSFTLPPQPPANSSSPPHGALTLPRRQHQRRVPLAVPVLQILLFQQQRRQDLHVSVSATKTRAEIKTCSVTHFRFKFETFSELPDKTDAFCFGSLKIHASFLESSQSYLTPYAPRTPMPYLRTHSTRTHTTSPSRPRRTLLTWRRV